jgi:hemerythrin-like domain-containing protein
MHEEFFAQLHTEHEEVTNILSRMQDTTTGAHKTRQDLIHRLRAALIPHMQAEQEAFYPALVEQDESHDEAMEALEEHHAAQLLFEELSDLPPDADNWKAKAKVLMELIEHHIAEEEQEIFELTEKLLEHDEIEEIREQFTQVEESLRQEVSA